MTDHQNNKLRMYGSVETVLGAHPEPLAGHNAAQRVIGAFGDKLRDLRDAAQAQARYAPQGDAKEAKLDALAAAAVPIARAVADWAEEHGDLALADQVDFDYTDLTQARDQDALDRAALIYDEAMAIAEDLGTDYQITPATLAALDGHIDAFAAAIGTPRHALNERTAQTKRIERLVPEIDRLLLRLDRLVEPLRGTPFYDEYHAARRIVDA